VADGSKTPSYDTPSLSSSLCSTIIFANSRSSYFPPFSPHVPHDAAAAAATSNEHRFPVIHRMSHGQ